MIHEPLFSWSVSLGSVVTSALLLLGGLWSWATFNAKMTTLKDDYDRHLHWAEDKSDILDQLRLLTVETQMLAKLANNRLDRLEESVRKHHEDHERQ